ncbi:MAG TPA: biopolymer transporter ExbD [Thermoanaerobaculia bacterium]|nr:biopolymer transporter ExbD [Thermoanaerobaculia bacterium]
MAMAPTGNPKSEINITPLVDVVLVLLIIFMVVTPLLQMGYDVKVPPKAQVDTPQPPADQLIVSLTAGNRLYLNKEEMNPQTLALRLDEILKNRRDKTVFFSAEDGSTYGRVVQVMDLMRTAGVKTIGIVLDTVSVAPTAVDPLAAPAAAPSPAPPVP